jgi:hypothetical protein
MIFRTFGSVLRIMYICETLSAARGALAELPTAQRKSMAWPERLAFSSISYQKDDRLRGKTQVSNLPAFTDRPRAVRKTSAGHCPQPKCCDALSLHSPLSL